MNKISKFSKELTQVFNLRTEIINNDKSFLGKVLKINKIYTNGPKRKTCIICNNILTKTDFISHNVPYTFCKKCNHLNGKYLITDRFNEYVFIKSGSKKITKQYSNNFNSRVRKIYKPKIDFLKSVIKKKFSLLDIGCGAGHLIKSCELLKINAIGVDPNLKLIMLGKKYIKKNELICMNFSKCLDEIVTTPCNVISLMFVLEHLKDPNDVFLKFKKSKAEYIYISVPLFSLAVMFETSFQNNYPRVLGGLHTNLYSKESLKFIAKKYNLEVVGEWWFGSDFFDLYSKLINNSKKNSLFYKEKINNFFKLGINKLQENVDKMKYCSEVHIIFKKNEKKN